MLTSRSCLAAKALLSQTNERMFNRTRRIGLMARRWIQLQRQRKQSKAKSKWNKLWISSISNSFLSHLHSGFINHQHISVQNLSDDIIFLSDFFSFFVPISDWQQLQTTAAVSKLCEEILWTRDKLERGKCFLFLLIPVNPYQQRRRFFYCINLLCSGHKVVTVAKRICLTLTFLSRSIDETHLLRQNKRERNGKRKEQTTEWKLRVKTDKERGNKRVHSHFCIFCKNSCAHYLHNK